MDDVQEMKLLLGKFLTRYNPENQLSGNLTAVDWQNYYDFITIAYCIPKSARPTVSKLADMFREKRMPQPGTLAILYAHGLYILARSDGKPIFKGGFNY